ncbi:MAG: thioredoxin domain-containing protein [Thermoanaerobaculales bacterium]|jgi:protein-disulfide isomerase|nr:thioredoxin domain-containing protein [Thermoanaerobaculales bacterium]
MNSIIRGAVAGALITVALVACAQPAGDEASGIEVAARFGDNVITVAELEEAAGGQLVGLYQQIYQVKDQQLRQMIYNQLIEEAAASENLTRDEYFKREVLDNVSDPTDEQIKQVLEQYRSQLPADEEQARGQVVAFLSQQSRAQQEAILKDKLMAGADVEILLDPPRVKPVVDASTPMRGPENAPVVIVEYTDYQCPYCVRAQQTIAAILARYGDSVVHVFKNLPLPMHAQAKLAAEGALCAGDQDKFWEMHDWLFANKSNISLETMSAQAGVLELDVPTFTSCVETGAYRAQVDAETREAGSFGIRGTPGFVINGRVLSGAQPFDAFAAVIDDELKRLGLPVPGAEEPEPETAPAPES